MISEAGIGTRKPRIEEARCDGFVARRAAWFSAIMLFVLLFVPALRPELFAQPTWIQVQTPTARNLQRVCFVDSLKGWIVGDSGTIVRTTNGGKSWAVQNSSITTPITEIFMLNERLGWALSITPWTGFDAWYGTTMLTTTNGGDGWSSMQFDSLVFYSVFFLDSLHGWMGGDDGDLVETTDGGTTWVSANVPPSFNANQPIHRLKFFSPSLGYAVGGRAELVGVIWKTADGGQHWSTTGIQDEMLGVDFSDSLHVVCVGGGPDDGAELTYTSDGGQHWQFKYLGFLRSYGPARAISFRTAAEAWVPLAFAGTCAMTVDSGLTWQLTTIRKGVNLSDVMFTDERHGWIVGSSGTVLRYNTPFLIPVDAGWNIVSLQFRAYDYRKSVLFPTAISDAFTYTPEGYQHKDTLANHVGYWMKFPDGGLLPVPGTPILNDTFHVNTGWNMIGSITEPVAASSIVTVGLNLKTPLYGYHRGYVPSDTIKPGNGYWVKSDSSGMLIVSSADSGGIALPREFNEKSLMKLNILRFEDGRGDAGTLYFGENPDESFSVGRYELPPVPPPGLFDVRFASQLFVELLNENAVREAPICISSAVYPLSISWDIKTNSGNTHLEVGVRDIRLQDGGKTVVSDATSPIVLKLLGKEFPREFALYQNYPNPFNPTTDFEFRIANFGFVSLKVYDELGREVVTLVNQVRGPGEYTVEWNAEGIASGIYYYRLTARPIDGGQAGAFTDIKKLLLIK